MKRKPIGVVLSLAVVLALAACGPTTGVSQGVNRATAEEVVSGSFNADKPTIIVETFNGNIDVTVGAGTVVKVDVTRRGGGQFHARRLHQ
jgi:ABC-type glycerol-3-phosphate transport system substrate-binding protein